ncbi:MAG: alpha/beta hydrolase [Sandaracinus sp.]
MTARTWGSLGRWARRGVTFLAAGAALGASVRFALDMQRARARIAGRSALLESAMGRVEYLVGGGDGPPVLVVHGSGGGFDQGELLARAALDADLRWIAPSRFGYLRSTFRPGATFDDQAHAYAALLDHLQIPRVAVLALSHGGPSALTFALLHPERVSSLTLVSAGVASTKDAAQDAANVQGKALTALFQVNLLYWAMTRFLRRPFLRLMGVNGSVVDRLGPAQRALVDELVDFMNPVAPRAAGVRFDNTASLPDARIEGIEAPTLVVHAKDDLLQLHRNAEYAAAHIRGARLVSFESGGHVVLALEQERIRALVREHLRAHPA